MPKTPSQIADKFEREWLEAKEGAIEGYTQVASTLAQKAIDAKQTMINNFVAVMATSKYEDRLAPYVGSNLMETAYTQAMNAKVAITDAEKLKLQRDVELKRALSANFIATIAIYKAQTEVGEVIPPVGLPDNALTPMLVQGVNANQFNLSAGSTPQAIYEATKEYMVEFLGWTKIA